MLQEIFDAAAVPGLYSVPEKKEGRSQMTEKAGRMEDGRHQLIYEVLRRLWKKAGEGFCTEVEIVLFTGRGVKFGIMEENTCPYPEILTEVRYWKNSFRKASYEH